MFFKRQTAIKDPRPPDVCCFFFYVFKGVINRAIINNMDEALRRIRVKPYPNYLPKVKGAYIARIDNEDLR
jgi:hypothetical protein